MLFSTMATTSLQDQLDEITSNTRRLVQAERLRISERSVEELFSTGIEEKILPVGAQAPEFSLKDANGKTVRSADLLSIGPLIVKFFRGRWCSYCSTELETWRDLYDRVRTGKDGEHGAVMVAISPQTARQNDFMAAQHGLPFPLLSDPGNKLAAQFNLAYTVSPQMQDYYRSILVNLPFINGDQSGTLPLPATYVISQSGKVLYAEAHADFRVRPEPEEVLAAAFSSR